MVFTSIFTTLAEIKFKAGAGVSTAILDTDLSDVALQVENRINIISKNDYSVLYPTLSTSTKYILNELASNMIAIYMISFDMSGYVTRIEAENILTILKVQIDDLFIILKDITANKYMQSL